MRYRGARPGDTYRLIGYQLLIGAGGARHESGAMTKRALAIVLWFIAGWYLGTTLAFVFHLSSLLAPAVALLGSALMGGDPRHVIWKDDAR
jgi:hypothetical protein